jgi:hypothetical protein
MRRIVLVAAALLALGLGGCMTAGFVRDPALGAAGYSYSSGRASQGFSYPYAQVQEAVVLALGDLEVHSIRTTGDAQGLSYEGKTLDGRRALVTIETKDALPVVSAKVGWFGDEAMSKALMDRIGIRLGSLPPSAIPTDPPASASSDSSGSRFSRSAIPDKVMLRDKADVGYRDSPVPY